jgi:hypothetical protein
MNQIGNGTGGEAVRLVGLAGGIAKRQGQLHGSESLLEPEAAEVISLASTAGRIRPDQGIGEITPMENGSAARGTTHQRQSSLTGKVQPVGGKLVLVSAQGQSG